MRKIIFVVFSLILLVSTVSAQTTLKRFKKPLMIVEVFGGYNIPMHELHGSEIGEVYRFQSYGVTDGFSAGLGVKFAVSTLDHSQFRLYSNFVYSHFTRSENSAYSNIEWFPIRWPQSGYNTYPRTSGISSARVNIPYVALGFEYSIYVDPLLKSHFAFGTDINMSIIFGRYYNQPVNQQEFFNTFRSNTRFGFGLNAAYNYRFAEIFGMTIGLRYQFNNLLGRSSEVSDGSGYMFLNDEANTSLNANLSSSRTIGSFSAYGGFNFYIGRRK